jgi:hypothetical protein
MRFSTSALVIALTAVFTSSSAAIESPRLRGNRGLNINPEEAEKLQTEINMLQTELVQLEGEEDDDNNDGGDEADDDDIPSLEDDTTPIEDDDTPSEDDDTIPIEDDDDEALEDDIPSLEDDTTPIEGDDDYDLAPEDDNVPAAGDDQIEEYQNYYGGPGGFYYPPMVGYDDESDNEMGLDDQYMDVDDETPMTPGDGTELEVVSASSSED